MFMAVTTFSVVLDSARPWSMKMILDSATALETQKSLWYLMILGGTMIGGNAINALSYFLADGVKIPLSKEIKETVFKKILDLDFAFHVEKNTGSLISAFRRGEGAIDSIFDSVFLEIYWTIIYIGIAMYFLFKTSTAVGWALVGVLVINLGLIYWLIKKNLAKRVVFNKVDDELAGIVSDTMINYDTVKLFAAEKKEEKRLETKYQEWTRVTWEFANTFRLMDLGVGSVSATGMLLMLSIVISKVNNGFSVGDVVMISGYVTSLHFQFFHLFFQIRNIAKNTADMATYLGILDNETVVKDPKRPVKLADAKGEIEFRNVGFVYPKNRQKVLGDINLVIPGGKTVAFVGRSGAGKTTIIKLLLRFYDPSRGKIIIDGVDIKKLKKTDLRSLVAVVPQEPVLFNNTIKYNLSYGKDNASMAELIEAAAKANILEFIEKLPMSWETQVGERGIKLSGGQKQRLAIARALLTEPKVLIFDEATSNLDSESEKTIQQALKNVAKTRTVVIVAHRFSTVRDADKIVVLAGGTVVESGKHEELVAQKGVYQKLWQLQTRNRKG